MNIELFKEEPEALSKTALEKFEEAVKAVLTEKKQCNIGLPGGSSLNGVFALLKHKLDLPWDRIHLFMVDERLVSITAPESNYRNAHAQFISVLTEKEVLPEDNVHTFFVQEFKNQAKRNYEREIEEQGGVFDILLLGSGEDGHVCSLFPNHAGLEDESELTFFVDDSPKPPPERITISKKMFLKSKYAFIFFLGGAKQEAYNNFNDDKLTFKDCPAKLAKEIENCYVFTNLE